MTSVVSSWRFVLRYVGQFTFFVGFANESSLRVLTKLHCCVDVYELSIECIFCYGIMCKGLVLWCLVDQLVHNIWVGGVLSVMHSVRVGRVLIQLDCF